MRIPRRAAPADAGMRSLGAPALIAIGLGALGSSLYFGLGVVAGDALGLTPLAYLLAGAFFVLTVMTYLEGSSLHPERGGASTFARYALNELWSFIAGWAILLDYLIVMAIAAFAVPHYLTAFWGDAGSPGVELAIAAAAVGFVAWQNIRGISADRLGRVLRVGLLNLGLSLAVIATGLAVRFDPAAIVDSIDLGATPTLEGLVFATVIAGAALTGVEAASGLAGEIRVGRQGLSRIVAVSVATVLIVLVGLSTVALMAVPVVGGSTALGGVFVDAPVLGVVSSFEPTWLGEVLRYAVGGMAALVLVVAMNGQMLGLSRLGYSLATNRQIPSVLGRLDTERSTPFILVAIASVATLALAASSDIEFLAGIFAFGAMLAFTIAHVSVVILRFREPATRRFFRVPFSIPIGRGSIPLPAALGALAGAAAWASVLILHEGARVVGSLWMAAGLLLYVVYRKSQGKALTKRFTIPAEALREPQQVQYGSILVPIFGGPLDDDIVGTAGRLAAEESDGEAGAIIEALYVLKIPMSLPIDARIPPEWIERADRALRRAREVGEEYEGVEVATAKLRGRTIGGTIVAEARRRGWRPSCSPPRSRRGRAAASCSAVARSHAGEPRARSTKYVLEKAPCRVLLTAPPAGEDVIREGVAP